MMSKPGLPQIDAANLAWLSTTDMAEVDRLMVEGHHIDLVQMMENAGRNLAQLAIDRYAPASVAVFAGTGGNGGGGLVAARHLANRGVNVGVTTSREAAAYAGVPGHQLEILGRMGIAGPDTSMAHDLVIDALIGYSLAGVPRGRAKELIDEVNAMNAPVLALDVPSGLNATTGATPGAHIAADATMTLALPKVGLRSHPAVGRLYVADISVPPALYRSLGLVEQQPFATTSIVEVIGR